MHTGKPTTFARFALLAIIAAAFALAPAAAFADAAADRQFVFAYRLLQQRDDKLAAQAFDDFISSFPRDERSGDARYYRAMLARRSGQFDLAAQQLAQIGETAMVPSHAVALLRGQVAYDRGESEVALQALEGVQLEGLDPQIKAAVLTLRGLAYRAAGNPTGAETSLAQAAAIDSPMQARALLNLGRVQAQLGKPADAVASLGKAMQLGQADIAAEAARLAGDTAYEAKNYEQAAGFYNQVIAGHQTTPHFAPSIVGLLWSHWQAGQYDALLAAYARYQNTLAGKPAVEAAYLAASAEQQLGKHEAAAARFEAIAPQAAQVGLADKVLYKAARSRFALGDSAAAKTLLSKLAEFENSSLASDGQFMLAVAEANEGDPAAGASKLGQIVQAGPDHPYYSQALFQRAKLHELAGAAEAAANDYRTYRDLKIKAAGASDPAEPASPQAVTLRLLDLYDRLGKFDEADAAATWLLSQQSLPAAMQQEALLRHGLVLIRMQKPADAIAKFETLAKNHPQAAVTPSANYYRGLLLMSQQKPADGIASLKLATTPGTLPADQQVAALRLIALSAMQQNNRTEANDALARIEKLAGESALQPAERLWLAKDMLAHNGDARVALRYLAPLVGEQHDGTAAQNAEAVYRAGVALRAINENDAAIDAFTKAVALGHGWDLPARIAIADTLAAQDKLDAALQQYLSLANVSDSQTAADAVFRAGRTYRAIARKAQLASDDAAAAKAAEEARGMFKRVTLLFADPGFSPLPETAHLELIQIELAANTSDLALKTAADLIAKYPKSPAADLGRAYESHLQNKPKQARFYLDKLRDEGNLAGNLQPYAQHLLDLLPAA